MRVRVTMVMRVVMMVRVRVVRVRVVILLLIVVQTGVILLHPSDYYSCDWTLLLKLYAEASCYDQQKSFMR